MKEADGTCSPRTTGTPPAASTHQPYTYSKIVAERAAWEIAGAQDRWDLVVINPGFVLGPSLTTASNSGELQDHEAASSTAR